MKRNQEAFIVIHMFKISQYFIIIHVYIYMYIYIFTGIETL